jgi:hypothetical protein
MGIKNFIERHPVLSYFQMSFAASAIRQQHRNDLRIVLPKLGEAFVTARGCLISPPAVLL